jgi:hypothetical protein
MLLSNLQLTYEPYPIGLITPIFEEALYRELVETFPPLDLFKFVPEYGNKYSLSEHNNGKIYTDYIAKNPAWRELHRYVKSEEFVFSLIESLRAGKIDLGIKRKDQQLGQRWKKLIRNLRAGRLPVTTSPIYSRFEFSALPANGGVVTPHTDAPKKFITLVVTMTGPGEWNAAWGGGTDILKPKDASENYNYFNRDLPYDQCDTLRTVEFLPNQAMLFLKTFNSLHGVKEMTGPSGALRRTLTINIQRDY